ncbi:uncharacterized protein LOC144158712 isoform X4 [Haemaphysalis longicornis]
MATPSNVSPMEASAPQQKRFIWTASLTHLLIIVWQDHLAQLRAQKHNAPVYLRMTAVFSELASDECGQTVRVTTTQMKHKMENLAQAHKKASNAGTGSAATECPFYKRLKTFLENLPMNDPSLVQESFQLDMIERLPEGAEVVALGPLPTAPSSPGDAKASSHTWTSQAWTNEVANIDTPASEPSTSQAPSPAPTADQGPTRNRRQQASPIDRVVELLERQENCAEKLAKNDYKLSKKTVRLHEKTNAIQRELVGIMRQYFAGQQERQPDLSTGNIE